MAIERGKTPYNNNHEAKGEIEIEVPSEQIQTPKVEKREVVEDSFSRLLEKVEKGRNFKDLNQCAKEAIKLGFLRYLTEDEEKEIKNLSEMIKVEKDPEKLKGLKTKNINVWQNLISLRIDGEPRILAQKEFYPPSQDSEFRKLPLSDQTKRKIEARKYRRLIRAFKDLKSRSAEEKKSQEEYYERFKELIKKNPPDSSLKSLIDLGKEGSFAFEITYKEETKEGPKFHKGVLEFSSVIKEIKDSAGRKYKWLSLRLSDGAGDLYTFLKKIYPEKELESIDPRFNFKYVGEPLQSILRMRFKKELNEEMGRKNDILEQSNVEWLHALKTYPGVFAFESTLSFPDKKTGEVKNFPGLIQVISERDKASDQIVWKIKVFGPLRLAIQPPSLEEKLEFSTILEYPRLGRLLKQRLEQELEGTDVRVARQQELEKRAKKVEARLKGLLLNCHRKEKKRGKFIEEASKLLQEEGIIDEKDRVVFDYEKIKEKGEEKTLGRVIVETTKGDRVICEYVF